MVGNLRQRPQSDAPSKGQVFTLASGFSNGLITNVLLVNDNGLFGGTVAGTDPCSTGGLPRLQRKKETPMNKFRFTINVLAVAMFTFALASIAQAQATRTWVSGVGDDANPCSRTAPCKTFAGAISKTAVTGEIDVLDNGGFGAVTITKAITIDGGFNTAGVLVSGTNAIVINAGTGDTVTLRNLDINGLGTGLVGIKILSAKSVHVDHCQIYEFKASGGTNGRAISDERTANQSPAAQLFVNDCFIRDNLAGIGVTGSSANSTRAFIDHCRIENNGGFGVLASNSNFVTVVESEVSGNLGEAVKIDTNSQANVITCVLNGNLTGVLNSGGSQFLLADTSIMNNGTGASGAVTPFGNNNVRNNGGGNTLPASVGQQ